MPHRDLQLQKASTRVQPLQKASTRVQLSHQSNPRSASHQAALFQCQSVDHATQLLHKNYENVFSFPINGRSKNGQVGVRYTRLAWMNVSCLRRTVNTAKIHRQQHCRPHFSRLFVYHATHLLQKNVIQQATTLQATLLPFMYHATHLFQKRPFNSQQQCWPLRLLLFMYVTMPHICSKKGSTVNNTAVLFMYHATHIYTPQKGHLTGNNNTAGRAFAAIHVPCHTPTPNQKGFNRKRQCRPNKRNAAHTCAADILRTRFATTHPATDCSGLPASRP